MGIYIVRLLISMKRFFGVYKKIFGFVIDNFNNIAKNFIYSLHVASLSILRSFLCTNWNHWNLYKVIILNYYMRECFVLYTIRPFLFSFCSRKSTPLIWNWSHMTVMSPVQEFKKNDYANLYISIHLLRILSRSFCKFHILNRHKYLYLLI